MMELSDIRNAYDRIKSHVVKTPVMTSTTIDGMTDCHVYFKCENFQRVGAFKFRGAFNTVSQLTEEERQKGVIAHSSGNHAQALALAARMLGVKATIVMPKNSPKVKVAATRGYGAEIIFCENSTESRATVANELIEKHGFTLVHPYNDHRIIAGAGTAALELIEEVGALDYVFAPVGGGGLLSGTAIATKGLCPGSKVIAVEPENADDAYRSFKANKIFPSEHPNTIADGLRTQLGDITFEVIRKHVDEIILVSEQEIIDAMRLFWERLKIVVEPSGAVSLAGLLKKRENLAGYAVGVIISGGNVDLTEFFESYSKQIS
ncbi:MAG: threonine/serine dehydratase [Candidatus Thorarchaeota archaeon]|nr:MAG: threonine/serine dehydratase [Candidatus Thorarchaeota archaeon]